MLKTPIKKIEDCWASTTERDLGGMKEVEDVAKQQMERVIAFPYQILGSAFAPLGMSKNFRQVSMLDQIGFMKFFIFMIWFYFSVCLS